MTIGHIKYLLILTICFISIATAHSQVKFTPSDFSAEIGDIAILPIAIEQLQESQGTINFKLSLANPTIYYPDSIKILGNGAVADYSIIRLSYGLYEISLDYSDATMGTLDIAVFGTALAGNDSVAIISIHDVDINGSLLPMAQIVFRLINLIDGLAYVRFLDVGLPYPNPVVAGNAIKWDVLNDLESELTVVVTDLEFKILSRQVLPLAKGKYTYNLPIDKLLNSGTYLVSFESVTGKHYSSFIVAE